MSMFLPSSTYRIQFNKQFTFKHLREILDYLQALGVDTIYASPILKSTAGSMHGYDVTDPHSINPEIGTPEEFTEVVSELKKRSMHWIQDIVPNHMAFSNENLRLMDVLERGPISPFYRYFDIDWNHPNPLLTGKVMVPFLGKEVEQCINDGEIKLIFSEKGIDLSYFETTYPLSISGYDFLLNIFKHNVPVFSRISGLKALSARGGSITEWLSAKRSWASSIPAGEKELILQGLEIINRDSSGLLAMMDTLYYRFTYWKLTEQVINYRRFFTVNSLICLSMESDEVFDEYHQLIFSLYRDGLIQGVRIDHIDGLNNPSRYLKKLRHELGPDCYIIAEKILESHEEVPGNWPLEGTSGYEFLSYVNQLFTDRKGTGELVSFYHSLLPGMLPYDELVILNKRFILNGHLAGELENLVNYFFELQLHDAMKKDRAREAIALFMLSLPVYRTYADKLPIRGAGLEVIREAIEKGKKLNAEFSTELDYLYALFLTDTRDEVPRYEITKFLRRLMQFTGPLMAKGVEDTTFYIYNPLISHVEVGDAPSTLGITIQEFHQRMIHRGHATPHSLNATATHDTKRGEDARMRLNVLSELYEDWMKNIVQWIELNKPYKTEISGQWCPILNDEYFIYQSILGGFPEDNKVNEEWVRRLVEYMIKVVREAKVMSDWSQPNESYEEACTHFIQSVTNPDAAFMKKFLEFLPNVLPLADVYSVAQAVIKITAPGIPDIYQGSELLDLSYVDPDNRRPVDFGKRAFLLDILKSKESKGITTSLENFSSDGSRKMFAVWKCLHLRKSLPEVFAGGAYLPLTLTGHGNRAIGYARYFKDDWCVVVVPMGLGAKKKLNSRDFSDIFISLPESSPRVWRNIFTDEPIEVAQNEIELAELFKTFPVAVLHNPLGEK
jgi:(1->4)-alpha-D-glucan 1-alpha-D-glucosylmutase